MTSKIVLIGVIAAFAQSPVLAQLTGGLQQLPMGGFSQSIGYKWDPLWGSLYQQHRVPHFPSTITYRGGADFRNPQGHGVAGSFSLQSGVGGDASLKAGFPIVNNPVHKVDGFAQLDRNLNAHLNPVGPETTKFGVNYKNENGAKASFSQTQTHGNPASKTIGASIPVYTSGDNKVTLSGESKIGSQQTLGVKYENQGSGASASLTGTQNNVGPARGTAAVSIPITNVGPATLNVDGSSTFGHGMKPDNQVGVKVTIPLN